MTEEHTDSELREERLDEVIADYLRQKNSANPPSPDEWRARYPEFESELAEFFENQQQVAGMIPGTITLLVEPPTNAARQVSDRLAGVEKITLPVESQTSADRYAVQRFLARGGMGEVWLAKDVQIGRQVALKKLRRMRDDDRDRFLVEAQVMGQLEHPNIVPLHDLGIDAEDNPFYVMKYVQGRTLKDALSDYHSADPSPSGSREVQRLQLLETFIDLCHAVAFAHSCGVLHRDLKPNNVMLGKFGETLLLDWGLAKVKGHPDLAAGRSSVQVTSSGGSTATQEGSVIGTPAYMPSEMAQGKTTEVDERTDVYLLGATLYEILTGQAPRSGSSQLEMVELARSASPTRPRKLDPTIPRTLEAICLKAMAFRKQDRYESAGQVAEDVQRYLAGEPVSVYRESVLKRAWRWCRRHQRLLKRLAAGLMLASVAWFALAMIRENQLYQAREQARRDLAEFRQLSDEAHFYAASSDATAENVPYYNLATGRQKGEAALRLSEEQWGPDLRHFPLSDQASDLKGELYDLLLLMAQTRLAEGSSSAGAGDILKLLDRARGTNSATRSYYRLRAECFERLGDVNQAARERTQAAASDTPTTALDHFLLGEQYRRQAAHGTGPDADPWEWTVEHDQLSNALAQYRAALRTDPNHYWSHLQLGRCLLGLGRADEAVAALGVALRADSPWGYSARGLALALSKQFEEARSDFDHVIRQHPDFRPARLNRGVSHWLEKNYEAALEDFDAVLSPPEADKLIEAAYYRALVHRELGNGAAALRDLDAVATEWPGFRPLYLARSQIHFLDGRDEAGLTDLNAYLQSAAVDWFDATSWQACHHRGRFLRRLIAKLPPAAAQRQPAIALLAETELRNAKQRGGGSAELFDDLGAVLELQGRAKEAIEEYSNGLNVSPSHTNLRLKRGWAYYLQLGESELASQDFRAVVNGNPEIADAYTGLGYIQAQRGSRAEAERTAARAILHGAGDYGMLHNVACIFAQLSLSDAEREKEDLDLAMDVLRRAVQLWKRGGSGQPNELELIKHERAFPPSMRIREDFQDLLE